MSTTSQLFILAALLNITTLPTLAMDGGNSDDEELARQLSRQINSVVVHEKPLTVSDIESSLEMLRELDPEKTDRSIQRQISMLEVERKKLLAEESFLPSESSSLSTPTFTQQETKFDRIYKKVLSGETLIPVDLRGLTDEEQLQLFQLQQENPSVQNEITNTNIIQEQDTAYKKSLSLDILKQEIKTIQLEIIEIDKAIAETENEITEKYATFNEINKELITETNKLESKLATAKSWLAKLPSSSTPTIDPREAKLLQLKNLLKQKEDIHRDECQEKIERLDQLKKAKTITLGKLTTIEVQIAGIEADLI